MGIHGREITCFIKPGERIRIMQDGCLLAELSNGHKHVIMSDGLYTTELNRFAAVPNPNAHTLPAYRDSPMTRQGLTNAGYLEDDLFS
jgi:signal transduction protein with GAF and PtsI domain